MKILYRIKMLIGFSLLAFGWLGINSINAHEIEHPISVSKKHLQFLGKGGSKYYIQLTSPTVNDSDALHGYCTPKFAPPPEGTERTNLVFTAYGGQGFHITIEMCPSTHYIWLFSEIDVAGFWINIE